MAQARLPHLLAGAGGRAVFRATVSSPSMLFSRGTSSRVVQRKLANPGVLQPPQNSTRQEGVPGWARCAPRAAIWGVGVAGRAHL